MLWDTTWKIIPWCLIHPGLIATIINKIGQPISATSVLINNNPQNPNNMQNIGGKNIINLNQINQHQLNPQQSSQQQINSQIINQQQQIHNPQLQHQLQQQQQIRPQIQQQFQPK